MLGAKIALHRLFSEISFEGKIEPPEYVGLLRDLYDIADSTSLDSKLKDTQALPADARRDLDDALQEDSQKLLSYADELWGKFTSYKESHGNTASIRGRTR